MIATQTDTETLTMRQAAEHWLVEERKPASQRTFASYVRVHIDPSLGDRFVKDIRNGALREFAQALAIKNLSAKTIQEILSAVKSIIAECVDTEGERLFPRDWNAKFIGAKPIKDQKTPCATADEIQAALERCSGIDKALIIFGAATGLRVGEIQAVRVAPMLGRTHWNPEKALVDVQTSIFEGIEQDPKTPAAIRIIELPATLNSFLKDFVGGRTEGYLFGNGHAPKLSTLRHHFDKTLPGHGFHSLRRHRSTFLDEKDCPPAISRYWMGHAVSSNDVHERSYNRLAKNVALRRGLAERIGLSFKLPQP